MVGIRLNSSIILCVDKWPADNLERNIRIQLVCSASTRALCSSWAESILGGRPTPEHHRFRPLLLSVGLWAPSPTMYLLSTTIPQPS